MNFIDTLWGVAIFFYLLFAFVHWTSLPWPKTKRGFVLQIFRSFFWFVVVFYNISMKFYNYWKNLPDE